MVVVRDHSQTGPQMNVQGRRTAWRRNFNGSTINTDIWAVSQVGAGITYSLAGGVLTVNQNLGINEELTFTSIQGFQLPFRVQFTHSMSQRIANNEVYLEVVNAAGNTYQGWMFDGTTTTQAKTTHMNAGSSTPASPTAAITVATSGTTPSIREIDCRLESVDFADRSVDSSGASSTRAVKTRTTLDPDELYYIRMRFKNTGVAPLSNTINTIETVIVQDTNDVLVEVAAARGNNGSNRSLSVSGSVSASLSSQSVTLGASSTVGTGLTVSRQAAVTATAGNLVKSTAGRLYGYAISNPGAAAAWFHIYNKATAPVVGTDTPIVSILVPPGVTVDAENAYGLTFSAGIGVGANDLTAISGPTPPATALVANIYYV